MLFREIDPDAIHQMAYRRTKYYYVIDEFLESGFAAAEILDDKIRAANVKKAIMRMGKSSTLDCRQIRGKAVLINRLKIGEKA